MSWRSKRWPCRWILGLGLTASLCGACADEDSDSDRPASPLLDAGRSEGVGIDAGAPRFDAGLPAEEESALSLQAPQAGKTSVYVPNAATHRVAVVNASTFAIESLAVGTQPTLAATVPGQDVALVLNAGTRDLALLRTEQGKTRVKRLEVGHDASTIAIAPDGLHALVYLDARVLGASAQGFQDLTVVDLTPGSERTRRVSVGFRPRGVAFSRDAKKAFVITEDGVSILDFAELAQGPTIARLVSLGDPLGTPQSVDVQVTPDGAYALARAAGDSTLRLVALSDGKIETLSLASLTGLPPASGEAGAARGPELTDLDLAPSGAYALAVLRDRSAIVRIPLPGGFRDPSLVRVRALEGALIGAITLAKNSKTAIAYTTAAPVESVLVIDDVESDAPARGIRLRKAVRAVALSDDGARALILHNAVGQSAATPANEDERIDAADGYTVLDVTRGFAKLQLTSAPVREQDVMITPDRSRLFALLSEPSKSVRALDVVDLGSFVISQLALARAPTSLGFVPDQARVFVGQAGEGGMITFVDASSGARVRDVSGFEIASRIRQ